MSSDHAPSCAAAFLGDPINSAILALRSSSMRNEYPRWRQGQQLADLGVAYERLKGRVPSYIFRFAGTSQECP